MKKRPLIIIGNEKVSKNDSNFYCDQYDEKSIPEGLSNYREITYIARGSKIKTAPFLPVTGTDLFLISS